MSCPLSAEPTEEFHPSSEVAVPGDCPDVLPGAERLYGICAVVAGTNDGTEDQPGGRAPERRSPPRIDGLELVADASTQGVDFGIVPLKA